MNVVLTGASGGIGSEIVRKLLKRGCSVHGISRNAEKLETLHQELGPDFYPVAADLLNREELQRCCQNILQKCGAIDVLINNAGILRVIETHRVTPQQLDEEFDTIVKANFLLTISLLPSMIERRKGLIINIASVAGEKASPKMAVYGAAKAAILNFTRSLALEYADKGIRAISISPGTVQTGLMDKFLLAMIQKKVPLKRLAEPAEIAELVEFLVFQENSYITGSTITIDGGISL